MTGHEELAALRKGFNVAIQDRINKAFQLGQRVGAEKVSAAIEKVKIYPGHQSEGIEDMIEVAQATAASFTKDEEKL